MTNQLDEEGIPASTLDHHGQGLAADHAPGVGDGLPDRPGYVATAYRTEVMAVGPTEKGQHLVVQEITHRRGEAAPTNISSRSSRKAC